MTFAIVRNGVIVDFARHVLAAAAGYSNLNSKGFANALGRCRSLGLINYPERSQVVARPLLFLE